MEGAIQYVKDRTRCFDNYFPCKRKGCKQRHVWGWIRMFHLHKQPEYLNIIRKVKRGDRIVLR